ncbi:MAG: hypothetical protein JSV24_03650 [Bacteroidales bacterium]|nr:MAG: hypothetical protein JSV24_03650 [Bacteroidales bacterium]
MKNLLLLFLYLLNCTIVSGQKKDSFFSVKSGFSYPVGNYARCDLEKGSFAITGINVNIEGGWYFLPWLGIGGQTGLNRHKLDLQQLAQAKIESDPFLSYITIRSEAFRTESVSAGVYGRWSFLNRFRANGKILGGSMRAKTPYQLYKPQYFIVGPEYFEITSSVDYSLLFICGAGLQCDITPYLSLVIEAEYQFSKMHFGFNTSEGLRIDEKNISFINLAVGFMVHL